MTPRLLKRGSVYGANPYRNGSSLCRAALNAGAIGTEGGQILVKPEKAAFFPAVLRHGVETSSSSGGMGFSVSSTADGRRSASPVFDGRTLDICPTDYGNFPEDAPPLTCGCDAASVKRGSVYGANPYRNGSSLCRAALNAGAIGTEGGQILVKPGKGGVLSRRAAPRRRDKLQQRGHGVQRKLDGGRPAVRQSCIRRTDARYLSNRLWQFPRGRACH